MIPKTADKASICISFPRKDGKSCACTPTVAPSRYSLPGNSKTSRFSFQEFFLLIFITKATSSQPKIDATKHLQNTQQN
jgi:hypothetical protein